MPDPVLLGLLQALQRGDASAQPALVDYLLERNDPRAELVRHAKRLARILNLFTAGPYLCQIARRLENRGLIELTISEGRTCFVPAQMRQVGFWAPYYLAEAISVAECAELNETQLLERTAQDYQFVNERFPARPFGTGEAYYLSVSLMIVPGTTATIIEMVRRAKLRQRWRMVGWGYEIPMIFDPHSWELHAFQRTPLLRNRQAYQAARSLIVEALSPPHLT